MKKVNWNNANKLATAITLFSAIIFIVTPIAKSIFSNHRIDATISIEDYCIPKSVKTVYYRSNIESVLPNTLKKENLSNILTDSLLKTGYRRGILRHQIYTSIPDQNSPAEITNKIDSLFSDLIYPLNKVRTYITCTITNKKNEIIKKLRLETPSEGYFELYENEQLINSGDFDRNINLIELRGKNEFIIKIWAYTTESIKNEIISKEFQISYENGSVNPKAMSKSKTSYIQLFFRDNKFLAYILAIGIISLITIYMLQQKDNE